MLTTRREFLWTTTCLAGLVALIATGLSGRVGAAESAPDRLIQYHGLRPTDPGGRQGLRNPERGWRIETEIAASQPKVYGPAKHLVGKVSPRYQEDWWVLDAAHFEPFGLTLAQTYCYLTEFADKPIPEEKLTALQESFDNLRRRGFKTLLRFAYERNTGLKVGPTMDSILRHIDQLQPILRRNADVIYVFQAGFIGAWGEWHDAGIIDSEDRGAQAVLLKRLLEALPDRMLQVRVPKYKRLALSQPTLAAFVEVGETNAFTTIPAARIGFHNDGFGATKTDGGTWTEPPLYAKPGNPEYDYMTRESAFLPVDGEMFWSDQQYDGVAARGKGVDGFNSAVRMRLHHFSSFSLAHGHSDREGKVLSMDYWMSTAITPETLRKLAMPIADGWFEDNLGQPAVRTEFEYLTDYLGYRLELQRARLPAKVTLGAEFSVDVELINRGFSTLHNPRPVSLVLMDRNGKVTELPATTADPRQWQPFRPDDSAYKPLLHKIAWSGPLPAGLPPGWYQIGLWLPDAAASLRLDPRYAVRVANRDVPWWTNTDGHYGINLLGVIEVVR